MRPIAELAGFQWSQNRFSRERRHRDASKKAERDSGAVGSAFRLIKKNDRVRKLPGLLFSKSDGIENSLRAHARLG